MKSKLMRIALVLFFAGAVVITPMQSKAMSIKTPKVIKNEYNKKKSKLESKLKKLNASIDNLKFESTVDSIMAPVPLSNFQSFANEGTVSESNEELVKLQKEAAKIKKSIKKYDKLSKRPVKVSFSNVTKPSNMTVKAIKKVLDGTRMEPLAKQFYKAEKTYKVNAIILMSIAALESGWGTSEKARRDGNYTGLCGSHKGWKDDNILYTARHLHNNYLTPGASYYKGKSLAKVGKTYCVSSGHWTKCVKGLAKRMMNSLK